MLKNRVFTTIWALPLVCLVVWFGEPWFTITIAVIGFLAALEFYRLTRGAKAQALAVFGTIWTVLLIVFRNAAIQSRLQTWISADTIIPAVITVGMIISLFLLLTRKQKLGAFTDWSWTFAGILYVGWFMGFLVALRGISGSDSIGRNWVLLALFATFGTDTTAYFIGKAFGKHKLAPAISPGKTWEGTVGGLLGAVVVSLFFLLPTTFRLTAYLNWWQMIIVALLISSFGQLGDLVESLFKRNTGAKDSGNIFPGHGGMLDRTDSIVFAVMVVYYIVVIFKLY